MGAQIVQRPSPNCGPRKGGILKPDIVVLHYTAMLSAAEAIERLCDPAVEVSAHYLIARDGTITQMVDESARAWHAGAGMWGGCDDINSRSIGIELDNDGSSPFSASLMDALEGLLGDIRTRWDIPLQHVIGHSDLAPTRKVDPGRRFDWRRLALGGHVIWPETFGGDVPLRDSLCALGYAVDDFGLEACLDAFRMRFAPMRSGGETPEDRRAAAALADRFAVDPWQRGS
ncbi:N-acetylmuramoyl-L-alanine amidase [Planktotalea sp.]|uniref:N-acetylmuramoyl-L-alanine amidase n=1 Tax=Planktotalea sp. TaxID=2029877 RepID=UPI0032994E54